ncbi:MAG: cyclase family protein [Atribacterota bacterium]|nr:cyclase family protein [Atribacterota bacterium]
MFKKVYDFTHKITEETYHPSGFPIFQAYENYKTQGCRSARLTIGLHFGTHLDAPFHFTENGKKLDDFHIKSLMGSAIVIDLSDKYCPEVAKSKPITIEDLENKLKEVNLEVRERDMVIINTGWHRIFSSEPLRYYRDYCTLSAEAGAWLASKKVNLVGLDACDVDEHRYFKEPPFLPPNHAKNFLPNNIFIIENVGGEIDLVLNKRIYLIVAPLNLGGFFAASSPIRLIGGIE